MPQHGPAANMGSDFQEIGKLTDAHKISLYGLLPLTSFWSISSWPPFLFPRGSIGHTQQGRDGVYETTNMVTTCIHAVNGENWRTNMGRLTRVPQSLRQFVCCWQTCLEDDRRCTHGNQCNPGTGPLFAIGRFVPKREVLSENGKTHISRKANIQGDVE